jgi:indole-3-glycerol phosphate synthase
VNASAPTVLARILAETRAEVERRRQQQPLPREPRDDEDAGGRAGAFRAALERDGIGVIAEFKRRSPSAGELRAGADVGDIVRAYERGGAVALSVLTESPNFGGSLDDLRAARQACGLPLLRKDFVIDEYQLHEARAAGADAVLLIVAALAPAQLGELHARARSLGLDVLVEVHDQDEVAVALDAGAEIVGVNNRDLRDFSVDVDRTERLLSLVPDGVAVVSESGIREPEQLRRLQQRGVAAVLVGEMLMRAPDPEAALGALKTFSPAERAL